jgi:3,4-dihydroxy 2-butanone 4-phosphate synthase/GTP cyclohydrolase II
MTTHLTDQQRSIANVLSAIEAIQRGEMIIMTDDEDRENEGDLILAAQHVSPEKINFMAKEARGLICLALTPENVDHLKLPMMEDSSKSGSTRSTAFTVSIEAREGVTTGISAQDRARTIQVAVNPSSQPDDLVVPGHVFPLRARPGGVLERSGHTEGSVDIARLAGLTPAAVICEIMNDDGTMARADDLAEFARKHKLKMVTIADLVTFRLMRESLVELLKSEAIETDEGIFDGHFFKSKMDGTIHLAITKGANFNEGIVDVRVHNQRPFVDPFKRGHSNSRIGYGLRMLKDADKAAFVYLCRSNPFSNWETELSDLSSNQIATPEQQSRVFMGDMRHVGTGAQILRSLGIKKMRVHSASSAILKGLSGFDLEIVENIIMPTN